MSFDPAAWATAAHLTTPNPHADYERFLARSNRAERRAAGWTAATVRAADRRRPLRHAR